MAKNTLLNNLSDLPFLDKIDKEKLEKIYGARVGIINALLERNELVSYHLYMFQSLSANIVDLFGRSRDVSSGGLGVGFNEKDAFWGCIGETLERYCMSYYNESEIILKKWIDLPIKNKIKNFDLYTDAQYKRFKNFVNPLEKETEWVRMFSYKKRSEFIYWPASLVYLPYEGGKPVAEVTSTGVAAYTNIDEAIKRAVLEIIERDAVMINFTMNLPLYEVAFNKITSLNLKRMMCQIKKGYKVKVYKLLTDMNVPVYLSLIWRNNKHGLHFGIGACADLNSDSAILKSLKECLFTYFYSKELMEYKKKEKNTINTLYEHFLYYQDQDFYKLIKKKTKIVGYKSEEVTMNDVFDSLKKNKLDVYYRDLTTEDICDTGIKVVRVIIPQMIDLNKSHILIRKGARRFYELPNKLGFKKNKSFSKLPHPFP